MSSERKPFINVDELMPQVSMERVAAHYGIELTWFGRDPEFEEKRRLWEAGGKADREPEEFHFDKGFHRGLELLGAVTVSGIRRLGTSRPTTGLLEPPAQATRAVGPGSLRESHCAGVAGEPAGRSANTARRSSRQPSVVSTVVPSTASSTSPAAENACAGADAVRCHAPATMTLPFGINAAAHSVRGDDMEAASAQEFVEGS